MPRFLLIGGFASSLINFRGPLLRELVKYFEVYAAAPYIDEKTKQQVEKIGATCISTSFERTGINPLKDIQAYRSFKKQVRDIAPDYVLAYTIKPVVFGLPASKHKGVKRFALITGRGSGFDQGGIKRLLVSNIVAFLYRTALKSVDGIVFQNKEDWQFFDNSDLLRKDANVGLIEGTGVDMDYYTSTFEREVDVVKFLFIARLIKEKGIPELVQAARILKDAGKKCRVQLLGWIDPNPGGISKQEIDELHRSGIIEYLGTTDDIRPYMDQADVFVLPSYYNEGLPRTIQEAMAMKKPIITTDHPGCRETVRPGQNGYLIPVRDGDALAEAMQSFIDSPELIESMGEESYSFCKEKFDVDLINERLLKFMGVN